MSRIDESRLQMDLLEWIRENHYASVNDLCARRSMRNIRFTYVITNLGRISIILRENLPDDLFQWWTLPCHDYREDDNESFVIPVGADIMPGHNL